MALEGPLYDYGLLPALIFLARIVDVSIGTMRIVFVSRERKLLAATLGFFEVLVWIVVMSQILQNLRNPMCYLAYGLGFASGNYIGLVLQERISSGKQVVRLITRMNADELISDLRESNYGVTVIDAEGKTGPVNVIYVVANRTEVKRVLERAKKFNPKAFYTVEDVKVSGHGVFPHNYPAVVTPDTVMRKAI